MLSLIASTKVYYKAHITGQYQKQQCQSLKKASGRNLRFGKMYFAYTTRYVCKCLKQNLEMPLHCVISHSDPKAS